MGMSMAMLFAMQTSRNLFFNFVLKPEEIDGTFYLAKILDFYLVKNCSLAINAFMNFEILSKM